MKPLLVVHISPDYGRSAFCGVPNPEKWMGSGFGANCQECYRLCQELIDKGRTSDGRYRNLDHKK